MSGMRVLMTAVVVVFACTGDAVNARFVMPWICADANPCGNDMGSVETQIHQLVQRAGSNNTQVFTDAAFENFGISNGKLVRQSTALDVAGDIAKTGVRTHAMVFSTSIDDMRSCWADTDAFIKSFNTTVVDGKGGKHVQGLNFDWEPNSMTQQDGKDFAHFLDKVAMVLHQSNIKVSVAGIRGAELWDYKALSKTAVDYVMDMNTYMDGQGGNPEPSDFPYFQQQIEGCLADLRLEQYVPCIEDNLTLDQLQQRFTLMKKKGIHKVALWLSNLASPLPIHYFPYFADL